MSAPKTPGRLKNSGRNRKLECFSCPIDGRPIIYASRANVAANGAPRCGKCGEAFMFSDPLDCADVTPDMLEYHPMHKDACVRELAAAREEELERRHVCDGCGERAPAGSDPANFYCAACGRLTSRREDGTVDVQRIRRGTGEYETARAGVKSAGELPRITYPLNVTLRPRAAVRPDPAAPAASSSEAPF